MAEKKRKKLLGDKDPTLVSKVEIFLIPKVSQAKIDAKKLELKEKEVSECTFAPKTLDYKGLSKKQQITAGDRNIDLYSLKKKGWFKDRGQKTSEDYELERGKQDMTFNPITNQYENVIKKIEKDKTQPKIDYIPGVDKVRDRMERARQQQLEKKLMTERGIPSQIAADLGKVSRPLTFQP